MSQNTNQKDIRNKPKPPKRKSLIDYARHTSFTSGIHSYQRSRSIDKGHIQINGLKLFDMIHQRTNSRSKSHSRNKSMPQPHHDSPLTLDLAELPDDDDDISSSHKHNKTTPTSPSHLRAKSSSALARHDKQIPSTPTRASPASSFVEHEKNTLLAQMKQLQSTMVQLGDMLRNQDDQLNVERTENKKLVEQVNNLADENMNLRQRLCQNRRERNAVWKDLQDVKLQERSRRDKIIFLTCQLTKLADQKKHLTNYSETLIEQLAVERERSHKMKMKIKKYTKNVKHLHKRTKSIGELKSFNKRKQKKRACTMTPFVNHRSADPTMTVSADMDDTLIIDIEGLAGLHQVSSNASSNQSDDILLPNDTPNMGSIYSKDEDHYLTQKRAELKQLEADTLEIIEQLEAETKKLLGDAELLTSRTDGFRRKKRSKNRRHRKKSKREHKRTHNDSASRGSIEDESKDNFFVASKVTTKTTTETSIKTTIASDAITTSKKETKVKTKFTYNKGNRVDISDEMDAEWISDDIDNSDHENDDNNTIENGKQETNETNEANKPGESDMDITSSMTMLSDDDDEDDDDLTVDRKAEVEILKKVDAPVSMLLNAFEKQMQSEMDNDNNDQKKEKNASSGGSSLFGDFNGFSDSDEDDNDNNDDISSLWG